MSYLEALDRELRAAGIPGRRRTRVLAEFEDHLRCAPDAELGDPGYVARQFADEVGTALARRAAFVALAGLAVAAVCFGIGFLAQRPIFSSPSDQTPPLLYVGALLVVLGGQVAFVAGGLAAVRAYRRRTATVLPRTEAIIIVRRAMVGLGAGILTMVGFGLSAEATINHTAGWWTTLALGLSGAGIVALVASAPVVLGASRLRPIADGPGGDVLDDVGPLVPPGLRKSPWRFALAAAGAVAIVITAAGIVQSDPFDGAFRGIADGAACLAGFALLGRYLGLRR